LAAVLALAASAPARAAQYTASDAVKIDVMGQWAHPDDDTGIIGPCGVWHDRYGIRCGIVMITRGEGGGNATGTELGPDLGLRRENEDRVAHFRSGTIDIFNVDSVDFFYNQSAPLTRYFWGTDTLRRIVRIIRTTQPDVYLGYTPTFASGHGNHQQAGRLIWEAMLAAADPNRFPEQLTGPGALDTWQVKKVLSGGSTVGTGGSTGAPDCTTGFVPSGANLDPVIGVWTGYDSPYLWPPDNVQAKLAGSFKSWAQVAAEGTRAYPTQSRAMYTAVAAGGCSRFGVTQSYVPFQPNLDADGTPNPLAGKDDAVFYGATVADPGGLPEGTLEYLTFSRFFNTPRSPFQATVHVRSGEGSLPAGTVALTVPPGWTVDPAKEIGPIGTATEATATFDVTPDRATGTDDQYRIAARLTTGDMTGYTDNVVRVVPPVEGRYHRFGRWADLDAWYKGSAPQAYRLGRSAAAQQIGVGETITVPVDVHNWSDAPQSGSVKLTAPASSFTLDAASKPFGPLAPGADGTVSFTLTNTDAALPAAQTTNILIETTAGAAAPMKEMLVMSVVPRTTIPQAADEPTLDGAEAAGEYPGPALDISRRWQGSACAPEGTDCGTSGPVGGPTSTYAKVAWRDDALYFFVNVRDDYQSYAALPEECFAHWLTDSVEILLDPRGNASQNGMDTAHTFKLGIFPFTNDPANRNGNGADGPCWARDADNHQGFSTGPLAATVDGAPNAPGVKVVSTARWVGDNLTTTDHAYAGGGYALEVKIPLADLPAAVDPSRVGLNITPYDNDDTAAAGTTKLLHRDQSTRLGWSALGSVQSDPYRWGLATVAGYTPPAGRPTTPAPPNVSHPNLNGAKSPQTIWQSACNGVPISGRTPAPARDRIAISKLRLTRGAAAFDVHATGPGTLRAYLWTGEKGYIPVFNTSCAPSTNPPPDYGLSACATTDGSTPPWSPDMSGRIVGERTVAVTAGRRRVSIPLDAAGFAKLEAGGSALVSFETPNDEVQAFDVPLRDQDGSSTCCSGRSG
jgi:LmbE family N-acetylglucosaminyl deacetylase